MPQPAAELGRGRAEEAISRQPRGVQQLGGGEVGGSKPACRSGVWACRRPLSQRPSERRGFERSSVGLAAGPTRRETEDIDKARDGKERLVGPNLGCLSGHNIFYTIDSRPAI